MISSITFFLVGFFGHANVYVLSHIIPLIIKFFKNSHEPSELLFPLEFGIDTEKYFYLIALHGYLSAYICTLTFVNGDTLLFIFLEHACGIFEIMR